MIAQAIKWIGETDGFLELIDQRKLPGEFTKLKCTDLEQVYHAIKTLAVRGAPAIGVTAAYGMVIAAQQTTGASLEEALAHLAESSKYLASSRPTAVNLFWALERVKQTCEKLQPKDTGHLLDILLTEANAIYSEDVQMCRQIGVNGEKFIAEGSAVLTHCNAGALATAGQGTALSPMFEAHKNGKQFKVYADETRPLLQGGRLTAWELNHAGIDVTVICDNMAGWLMKQKKIDAIIVGADRIAANGDTANKIGTYSVSILAARHDVPFYVAAPSSTFDMSLQNGEGIPIEERSSGEVAAFGERQTCPDGVNVYNPAFDVTDAANITAIITEKGVIERPDTSKIKAHLA